MELRKVVGTKVAQLRKQHSYSQEELARLLSLNKQTVWRIESGATNVSVDTLAALAKALKVEPAVFLVDASAPADAHHAKLVDGLIESLKSALHLAVTLAPRLRA